MVDKTQIMQDIKNCTDEDPSRMVNCSNCPHYNRGYPTRCRDHLLKEAFVLLKEQEWISVKDRLPNCNGCYLVWRPRFYTEKGMPSICYFDGQNTWHDSYGVDFTRMLAPEDVSHWMPLPEPPNGKR